MLVGGTDGHSGSVEMAVQAATAAVGDHKSPRVSMCRPVSRGEVAGQWGRGGLGCLHRTVGRVQKNIQNPERREGGEFSQRSFSG